MTTSFTASFYTEMLDNTTRHFDSYSVTGYSDDSATMLLPVTQNDDEPFSDVISDEALRIFETVVNGGILPVLVLCGVIGNVINMAVFVRQGLGDCINLCLFSLAISDTGFSVSHLASRTFVIVNLFDQKLGEYWQPRALRLTGVYLGFLLTSNTITLVIALQRSIVVISPLSAKKLLTSRQMVFVIVSLFVLCMLGTGAYSFKWEPRSQTDPVTNVTRDVIALTDAYVNNSRVWDIVVEMCFNIFIPVTSLVVVITANVIIAVRMRSVLAWRKGTAHAGASLDTSSSTTNQRETAMTKMLLVVCVVYSICTTPTAVQAVARLLVPEFVAGGRYNNISYASLCVSHLLESVNCSVNFLIYYNMSSRFNSTLREMFRRRGERTEREEAAKTRLSVVSESSRV